MNEFALNQLRSKFTSLLNDFPSPAPALNNEEFSGPSEAFLVGSCGTIVTEIADERIIHMSSNLVDMLGLSAAPTHFSSLRSMTHSDYKESCRHHFNHCQTLFNEIDDARSFKIKAGHCMRMTTLKGDYLTFYRQFFPLAYNEQNKLSHLLMVYTDVSHIQPRKDCNLAVIGLNGNKEVHKKILERTEHGTLSNQLSTREIQVMRLVASNHSTQQIAEKLFLSPHTVKIHRRHLLRKTGTKSSLELVMLAKDKGWI